MLNSFLVNSSPVLVFLYFFLFGLSEITFAFLISTFFSKAKLAAIVGPIALFITVLPKYLFFGFESTEDLSGKRIASILSPTAFSFGADVIADYEYAGVGVNWENMWDGDYTFATSILFMAFDTVLYAILAWYCDKVLPSEYGPRLGFLFFLQKSYWTHSLPLEDIESGNQGVLRNPEYPCEDVDHSMLYKAKVKIRHMRKVYGSGGSTKVAVKDMNLDMFEDQITCLLGHNGAGKTTLISILTGLFSPTSGDCSMYGLSVIHNLEQVRQELGVCPQHNVLFAQLTVAEHIELFASIKGVVKSKVN